MSRHPSPAASRKMFLSGIIAAALFAVTVGIGISIVTDHNEPVSEESSESSSVSVFESEASSVSEPVSEESSAESEASSDEASSESSSSSAASSAAASSTSSAASSSAATQTSSLTGIFDASVYTGSGQSNIADYRQINSDVKGWLKIPGTNINYPVLHHSTDINYYLERDLYKQWSKNGVIWASPTVKFGDSDDISDNTVLFGHNWTNYSANPRVGYSSDVMFAQLTSYHHLNFAKQYPYIYYSTSDEAMTWVIFAAFYTDVDFNYVEPNPSTSALKDIISGAKARSRHIFDVDVDSSDKILTLSTCTRAYGSSDRQRFVVMARLLRNGESIEAIDVTTNPNPVLPNL